MRRTNHAGLEAQRIPDILVDVCARVVPHDEVVPVVVLHLVHGDGPRKGEDPPVAYSADDTTVTEDDGADCVGDSIERYVSIRRCSYLEVRIGGRTL